MSRTVITQEKIIEINEAYLRIKTYAGVARELGISPSTVKKYIISDYTPKEQIEEKKFDITKLSDIIDFSPFKNKDDWGDLCVMSEEEWEEVRELQKEIRI